MVDVLQSSSTHSAASDDAFEVLSRVPDHHPFWDEIDSFVARVRALAADKLTRRELKRQEEELLRGLGHLREIGKDVLTFHEALDVLEWTAADFDPVDWPAVSGLALDLYEMLMRHGDLSRVEPANRTAAKERRRQLDQLEEEIVERLEKARRMFVGRARTAPATRADHQAAAVVSEPDDRPAAVHAALDAEREHYSVFTLGEERRLMSARPGVCLVFASAATGLDSVDVSFASMARRHRPLIEVPDSLQPGELASWIRSNVDGSAVAWQRLGRWSTELDEGVRQLLDAQQEGGFRILLVGGPAEARSFVAKGQDAIGGLDDVIACGRWQLEAIDARIRETQLAAGSRTAADVMAATRGWHRLVEVLWMRKSAQQLDSMIAAFNGTFRSPGGYSGFQAALGLSAFPEAETVFGLLAARHSSPLAPEATVRWILDSDPTIKKEIVTQAIAFLHMFQLLELDAGGNEVPDPLARAVLNSEP
jgi:hypothetical protein